MLPPPPSHPGTSYAERTGFANQLATIPPLPRPPAEGEGRGEGVGEGSDKLRPQSPGWPAASGPVKRRAFGRMKKILGLLHDGTYPNCNTVAVGP